MVVHLGAHELFRLLVLLVLAVFFLLTGSPELLLALGALVLLAWYLYRRFGGPL